MPRFFVDLSNGFGIIRDNEGVEHQTLEDVQQAAIGALIEALKIDRSSGNSTSIVASVRDEADKTVFQAKITLETERV